MSVGRRISGVGHDNPVQSINEALKVCETLLEGFAQSYINTSELHNLQEGKESSVRSKLLDLAVETATLRVKY